MLEKGSNMTATLPPVDSSDHDLADEISDVIDEHGRGLEADELSKIVERVAGRLEGQFDEEVSTRELAGELHRFVADQAEAADRKLCVDTLRAIADSLRQGSLAPEADYRQSPPDERLAVVFDSAFALRQTIPNLLDIRGYFVETDTFPATREEITIVVEARHLDRGVELCGRVIRSAPNGIAIQVADLSPGTRRKLRELADCMRRRRRERTG